MRLQGWHIVHKIIIEGKNLFTSRCVFCSFSLSCSFFHRFSTQYPTFQCRGNGKLRSFPQERAAMTAFEWRKICAGVIACNLQVPYPAYFHRSCFLMKLFVKNIFFSAFCTGTACILNFRRSSNRSKATTTTKWAKCAHKRKILWKM